MDILRFITAGSVDDDKSTLIGRLLYDSKSILIDQLEAIEKQSKNKQNGEGDLARIILYNMLQKSFNAFIRPLR